MTAGVAVRPPVTLVGAVNPLRAETRVIELPEGQTLREMVDLLVAGGALPPLEEHLRVCLGDQLVPRHLWHRVRPKAGTRVQVMAGFGKGGGILPAVLGIAVIAAASFLAFPAAFALAGAVGAGSMTAGGTFLASTAFMNIAVPVIGGAITLAGHLAINALFPTRPPKLDGGRSPSQAYSLAGPRNAMDPFGPVTDVLGKHRVFAKLGAPPYTELVGQDQYMRLLLVWGAGRLKVANIRIGETPIGTFEGVDIQTREGTAGQAPTTLYPGVVIEDQVGATLEWEDNQGVWVQRTTASDIDEFSVDIGYPRGLITFTSKGKRNSRRSVVVVEFRKVGDTPWTPGHTFDLTQKSEGPLRFGARVELPERAQYEVRLRRTTNLPGNPHRVFDEVQWLVLRGIRDEEPLNFPVPMAVTALRILAGPGLQGQLDQISAEVTTMGRDWNGAAWADNQEIDNPGALLRHVWQRPWPINPQPRATAELDLESLQGFHAHCAENGFRFNMVRDFEASVWDTLQDIASAGRGRIVNVDGKWGVVWERDDDPVVNLLTPRESWGFQAEKLFRLFPHAWRVRFINELNGYSQDERLVFADGFSAGNAERYEEMEFPGKTHPDEIFKFGRYTHAAVRLRPEFYQLNVGWAWMTNIRLGRRVRVAHDVIRVGLAQVRVADLLTDADGSVAGVVLDEPVVMVQGTLYAVEFRTFAGGQMVTRTRSVETHLSGRTEELFFSGPGDDPEPGDLLAFGEAERVAATMRVYSIRPGPQESAQIVLVDDAPEIRQADQGPIPPFDPQITRPVDIRDIAPPPPRIVYMDSGSSALIINDDGTIVSRIMVLVSPASAGVVTANAEVQWRVAQDPPGKWRTTGMVPLEDGTVAVLPVEDGVEYQLRPRAFSPFGVPSIWGDIVTHTVIGKTMPPPDPDQFTVERMPDGTRRWAWTWAEPLPPDFAGARLRYGLGFDVPIGQQVPLFDGLLEKSPTEANELAAGDYTFSLVGEDSTGNESPNPAIINAHLDDPRLRNVLAGRFYRDEGWPAGAGSSPFGGDANGELVDCFVNSNNDLEARSIGGWDDLPDTWDALPDSWRAILPNRSPIRYRTPVLDIGIEASFTPLVTVAAPGADSILIEARYGDDEADPTSLGAWEEVQPGTVQGMRYAQFRISVEATLPLIQQIVVLLDSEVIVDDYEDIDTAAPASDLVERISAGRFKVATRGRMSQIAQAQITALQGVGPGWSWEVLSKSTTITGGSTPAAEFRLFNAAGNAADALVDVSLKGPKA